MSFVEVPGDQVRIALGGFVCPYYFLRLGLSLLSEFRCHPFPPPLLCSSLSSLSFLCHPLPSCPVSISPVSTSWPTSGLQEPHLEPSGDHLHPTPRSHVVPHPAPREPKLETEGVGAAGRNLSISTTLLMLSQNQQPQADVSSIQSQDKGGKGGERE